MIDSCCMLRVLPAIRICDTVIQIMMIKIIIIIIIITITLIIIIAIIILIMIFIFLNDKKTRKMIMLIIQMMLTIKQ